MDRPNRKRSASNSDAQRKAEAVALPRVAKLLKVPELRSNHPIAVGSGRVSLDGFWEDESQVVMVEVNAHVGRMLTGTRNKVLKDAFKMLVVAKCMAESWRGKRIRPALVFVNKDARDSFGPRSWGDAAFKQMEVETIICKVTPRQRAALATAQRRQDISHQ